MLRKYFPESVLVPRWLYAGDSGDGAGEGGSEGGDAELQAKIDAAVTAATAGLRKNRDEILAEKKQLGEQVALMGKQVSSLGGEEGIKKLIEIRAKFQDDEVGKLLADGKYEEWYETKTAAMRADQKKQTEGLQKQIAEADARAEAAESRWNSKVLESEVRAAASASSVIDTAHDDVILHAKGVFTWDPDRNQLVIKEQDGGVVFGKDATTPKSLTEWLEEQKQVRRHWWPASQGADAGGSIGGGDVAPAAEAIGAMNAAQYKKYRESQGIGQKAQRIPG
jgi:hypothetical protein